MLLLQMSVSINELYSKSTLIEYRNTDEKYDIDQDASATGFFYEHEDDAYLVTNEHVVLDDSGNAIDSFDIRISPTQNVSETERRQIKLLENDSERWYGHEEADVAIVPLELDFDSLSNLSYGKSDILPRNAQYQGSRMVSGGESAVVIGFPMGFTGANYLPIIRNALISTPYGLEFNDTPCFLTDSQMHEGMSGSPVLTDSKLASVNFKEDSLDPETEPEVTTSVMPVSRRYLLGIHSGPVSPVIESDISTDQQPETEQEKELHEIKKRISDLELLLDSQININRVWYADLIHHILSD